MVRAGLVGAIGKYRIQAVHRLAFPRAHLVGMHLVTRGDLLDRLVAAQRFQRYAGLEGCREPAKAAEASDDSPSPLQGRGVGLGRNYFA